MKLLCFGDSNTFGYDSRGPLASRYDEQIRWCDQLALSTGWQVLNRGKNGRVIPASSIELEEARRILTCHSDLDHILIMLGTNDVLLYRRAWRDVVQRMTNFLTRVQSWIPHHSVLLLSPLPLNLPEQDLNIQIPSIAEGYRALADAHNYGYIDTYSWNPELSWDGVHLSEVGHRQFADALLAAFLNFICGLPSG